MVIRVMPAIEITFDPKKITFGELLEIFLPHMIQLL
jgi:peptide methionine sulfoxide reductase MsrA